MSGRVRAIATGLAAAVPDGGDAERLVFLSPALRQAVRLSGTPSVELRASANQTDTNLGAILVDHGTGTRVNHRAAGEGITTLTTEDCWGASSPTDDPCYRQTQKNVATADSEIVTKGILDALNRNSLKQGTPLVAGETYTFRFPFLREDYVFGAGHQIGLILVGSYPGYSSQADQTRAQISASEREQARAPGRRRTEDGEGGLLTSWGNPWFPHGPPPLRVWRGWGWCASRADEQRFGGDSLRSHTGGLVRPVALSVGVGGRGLRPGPRLLGVLTWGNRWFPRPPPLAARRSWCSCASRG